MSAIAAAPRSTTCAAAPARVRRVCLVTEASGGGVGRHFLDLAQGLVGRGLEVVAVYSPGRCDEAFARRMPQLRQVRFIPLAMRRAVHPGDFTSVWQLVRCLRREAPIEIIHGHSSKGGAIARLAARWLGVPSVYTPHAWITLDPQLSPTKRWCYGLAERWLGSMSAAIIAVSQDEAGHARQLGVPHQKVHVVHNGIEPPAFSSRADARQRLGFEFDDVVVGFVGRLVPQKAPDVLIDAFARVAATMDHARLVIVGGGPLDAAIRAQIQQHGLEARVRLVGEADAASFMPAFDVFCLPSRYEGLPYVLLEAMTAELPIVATRVGGATSCVASGKNGFLVECGQVEELAAALLRLAHDPDRRARFGAASAVAARAFSLSAMIDLTVRVYESVAKAGYKA
jgi:glycosyltransferase involved in cell wall biosynthesis